MNEWMNGTSHAIPVQCTAPMSTDGKFTKQTKNQTRPRRRRTKSCPWNNLKNTLRKQEGRCRRKLFQTFELAVALTLSGSIPKPESPAPLWWQVRGNPTKNETARSWDISFADEDLGTDDPNARSLRRLAETWKRTACIWTASLLSRRPERRVHIRSHL